MSDVSILIVNWNTRDLLAVCLHSIAQTADDLCPEIIVVDNASTDDSVRMVRKQFPQVRVIENVANDGFARANNQAMALSHGRYMLLLNSDAVLTPGAPHALLRLAESQPRAAIIGARLLNPDHSFQASHSPFPTLWQELLILTSLGRRLYGRWYPSRGPEVEPGPQCVDYVEGACLFVRREAWVEAGGSPAPRSRYEGKSSPASTIPAVQAQCATTSPSDPRSSRRRCR